MKKFTYEYVSNYFKEHDCELLDLEYISIKTKMKYICKCGNESFISFDNFKNGNRCKICGIKKYSEKQLKNFDDIKKYIEKENYILLTKKEQYINTSFKLDLICPNNHLYKAKWSNFYSGYRCKECSNNNKYSYEYVYNYFKDQDCELLEKEYINVHTKMKYICNCGNKSEITFSNFKNNECRCKLCSIKKQTGLNNWNWNPNREELTINQRLRHKRSKSWIKNNLQHDPNYNNYLNNPTEYHIDHIIPICAFTKILLEQNLNENKLKKIANQKENLQILTTQENLSKNNQFSQEELNNYINKYY